MKNFPMRNFIVTVFVFALVAAAPGARADIPEGRTALCKSGPVLAACPPGVESNVSVATPGAQSNGQSVAFGQLNPQSVVPANGAQSVSSAVNNNNGSSVAYSQGGSQTSGSVAYSNGASSTSGSVADVSSGGGGTGSVVH